MEHFLQPRDPRFRRRINEIGHSIESANEAAQSNIYIFGQQYVKPCFQSIGSSITSCVNASCPALNLSQRDRLRRQRGRGRSRGRAELNFDFYDDWEEDEGDGLLGWGNDEFDSLVAGRGYGTLADRQPGRQRGMSYPKGRRKSAVQPHDGGPDPTVISGPGWFGKLFGTKSLRYTPSAADLQEHPGARHADRRDLTEGEALLGDDRRKSRGSKHGRNRSGTMSSDATSGSLSSRGDLFPSDDENDAIPLDDEFAMVLERRTTQSGSGGATSGPETDNSSGRTRSQSERRRGKRPSAGSRSSTKRTFSSVSMHSSTGRRSTPSRRSSSLPQTPAVETAPQWLESPMEEAPNPETPTLSEMKQEEQRLEAEEEAEVLRKREQARRLAVERGLAENTSAAGAAVQSDDGSSKEATPHATTPATMSAHDDASQLPTPAATDDEADAEDMHRSTTSVGSGKK